MNMLTDGTCFIEDFMKPAEKLAAIDQVIEGRRREEEILQAAAAKLVRAGWTVFPPRGTL